ncbi:hypothetical protein [Nonomuraea roseoviolacea]|uniref:Uncharacterized protein n=1 Tax=Nonomuraea roseoviolacea subsp. carminata TaxID=160689 RepID=A0ABT1K2R7_9ACTN|nr:hypothetical protein [Nonomuraea roseoviolacea]MCP2348283.1 hypothetical protein [Nonomuraea roseoviolacea subsp. carminata]
MRPLRWRVSLALWGAAFVLALTPWVVSLFATETYGVFLYEAYSCPGFELRSGLSFLTVDVWTPPAPAVVAVGFAAWALLARKGHLRWARVAGRATAVVLSWNAVLALGTKALDVAVGCSTSEPFGAELVRSYLYDLVVAALIVLAVRTRRAVRPRWSTYVRVLLALVLVLLIPRTDAAPGKVTEASPELCERWDTMGYGDEKTPDDAHREQAYLCVVRQEGVLQAKYFGTSDDRLLAIGRRLCRDPSGASQDVAGELGERRLNAALRYLCPDLARRQDAAEERARAENERFIATARRRCDRLPRHRPRIPAVRAARAALWSESGTLYASEEEPGEDFPALDDAFTNHLVGSAPGQLAILTADEAMHVCVTVEASRRRPPVELKGWEQVVEVGYRSTTGDLRLIDDDGGDDLPDLTAGGRGAYRVRVHMRGLDAAMAGDDARQEFLVMVYPGTSTRQVVLRK